MSKNKIPKGYSSKSVKQLQEDSQRLLFELGQMAYNEDFARRKQYEINQRLEELESALNYASQKEANEQAAKDKQTEKENEQKRAEYAKAKEATQTAGTQDESQVSNP